jgi:hypothetical protein
MAQDSSPIKSKANTNLFYKATNIGTIFFPSLSLCGCVVGPVKHNDMACNIGWRIGWSRFHRHHAVQPRDDLALYMGCIGLERD